MKIVSRDDILGHIRYRDITCPDAGTVSVFDYISAGAMSEFAAHRADPEAALAAVVQSSLEDSGAASPKLTANDYAALAEHFVSVAGVKEHFDAQLPHAGVANAFVQAIEQSSDWQSHIEAEERMKSDLERFTRPFNSVIREVERHRSLFLQMNQHAEYLRQIEKLAIPPIPTAIVELESFKSLALSSVQAISQYEKLHQNALANLQQWNGLAEQFASQTQLAASMLERQNDLTRMVDRISQIKPLVAPIADLSANFADMASLLRAASGLSDEFLGRVDASLAESTLLTLKTSDFFAKLERPLPITRIEPALPEAAEEEEEIRSAYDEGETILHEETAIIVAGGTSLVASIREVVGSEIDQRFSKYENLLARLESLSQPMAFLDFLEEFSVIAARDYWGSLWAVPGDEWLSRPERLAQAMLGMFLHGRWSGVAFVGREIANGDGFVDLLVNFMARDYIVELKMIGAGWPVSHAESGLPQLEQYMANYHSQEAYLVVFDGRKTNRGRQLPKTRETKHGPIHVIVIPAYFDAPSKS